MPSRSDLSQSPEPARRKAATKRRAVVVSDSDQDDATQDTAGSSLHEPKHKRARRSYSRGRTDEMNVDIEDEPAEPPKPSKKKRTAAVFSSDEEEEEDPSDEPESSPLSDVDNQDYETVERTKPIRRKTATWKVQQSGGAPSGGKGGKKGGLTKSNVGRGKGGKKKEVVQPVKDILIKDERTSMNVPSHPSLSRNPSMKKEEDVDVKVDVDVNDPQSPSQQPADAAKVEDAAAPTKKKLPTIKKTKLAPGTGQSTPAHAQPQSQNPIKPLVADKSKALPTGPAARKPAGTSDFDLRDQNAWASIFKGPGGSTPRMGLSRREREDERRKELYKMRDEAKAQREESLKITFDLQAPWDKISRFEERLRKDRCSALHPNLFAAKFRDDYEREKRRREKDRLINQGRQERLEDAEMTEMADKRAGELLR